MTEGLSGRKLEGHLNQNFNRGSEHDVQVEVDALRNLLQTLGDAQKARNRRRSERRARDKEGNEDISEDEHLDFDELFANLLKESRPEAQPVLSLQQCPFAFIRKSIRQLVARMKAPAHRRSALSPSQVQSPVAGQRSVVHEHPTQPPPYETVAAANQISPATDAIARDSGEIIDDLSTRAKNNHTEAENNKLDISTSRIISSGLEVNRRLLQFGRTFDKVISRLENRLKSIADRKTMENINEQAGEHGVLIGPDLKVLESPCPQTKFELRHFTLDQCEQAACAFGLVLHGKRDPSGNDDSVKEAARRRIALHLGIWLD
ncbi:hypothetical protein BT96DRAFT_990600 [Gymnopus androsaceus JB14]|uniref:Uncharacterized protein n=1 Tax=Gymnopus androsaceus JB14 TaxID=1447944 RepID=A0A6A4I2P8_9AGAR|nr:hypothetical protein BT96DRAFT_990600 [Gymnopus androsaceus JB14]